jgi:hypothetical protein
MSRATFIFLCIGAVVNARASPSSVQTGSAPAPSTSAVASASARPIDGVAARIEDDIITQSEVRELAAFQRLVDGHAKPRAELMEELANQWIAANEARVAYYPQPSEDDVNHLFEQLVAKFPSKEEFDKRCAEAGITEADVRRLVAKQLFLSRFLDYRFRPAAQIDQKQIEAYYNDELIPQLKSQGQPIPPLEDVDDTIREVLVQRVISERSTAWLNETRARLKMDVMPEREQP